MKTNSLTHSFTREILMISVIAGSILLFPLYSHADNEAATSSKNHRVNLTCMQTAVDTRETKITNTFKTFQEDTLAALAMRKTALNKAWGESDKVERGKMVKSAWADWKTAQKKSHTALKVGRKSAWENFKTTVKTSCKETLPKEEMLQKDAAGTVSL
jgi:hypothetical protein